MTKSDLEVQKNDSSIMIKPLIVGRIDALSKVYEQQVLFGGLGPTERKKSIELVDESFKDLDKISLKGDPDTLVKSLDNFYNCCDQLYAKMGSINASRQMTWYFITDVKSRLMSFANSGSYPKVEIEKAVEKSVNFLAMEIHVYQRNLRYK
jgi:hypothetical protein